jgi:hypothetical protein
VLRYKGRRQTRTFDFDRFYFHGLKPERPLTFHRRVLSNDHAIERFKRPFKGEKAFSLNFWSSWSGLRSGQVSTNPLLPAQSLGLSEVV